MKAKMTRRILALILTLAMVLTLIPAVFASDFTDVPAGIWYENAVNYCAENGLMIGTTEKTFGPSITVPREQAVQTLYAMAGRPSVTYEAKFSDVPEKAWFANAIIWAVENGITAGVGNGKFGVGVSVTREQIATFFYKYSLIAGLEEDWANLKSFPDASKVSSWALTAMQWAVKYGIISGKKVGDENYLKPQDALTRAELAVMLKAFDTVCPDITHVHVYQIVGAVEPTCTEPGYTGDKKCSECSFVVEKGSEIAALGHIDEDSDKFCDRCNEWLGTDDDKVYTLSTEIKNGMEVVIYNPGHGMAIKNETDNDWYLVPETITPEDDKITAPDASLVWTIVDNGNDTYSFVNGENKIMCWVSGTYFELTNNAAYTNANGNWKLIEADAATSQFFIQHESFSNNYGPAYIECYYNANKDKTNIAGYSSGNPGLNDFGFQFYAFGKGTASCEHNWVAGTPVAATCTEDGYTLYTCSKCQKTEKRDIVAKLGHIDDNDDKLCDRCGASMGTSSGEYVAIFYPAGNKVMTTESKPYNNKDQLVSADAVLKDGELTTTATNVAEFEMIEADGTVTFKTKDGKFLYADGTHVRLAEAEDDNTKFVLEDVEGGKFIKCANAQYSGKAQYIEFYANVFTVYSMDDSNPGIYTFDFYPLSDGGDVTPAGDKTFTKVTGDQTDWAGSYVIGYELGDGNVKIFDNKNDTDHNNITVALDGDKVTVSEDYAVIVETSGDGYTFKSASGFMNGKEYNNALANGTEFAAVPAVGKMAWNAEKGIVEMTSALGSIFRYNNGEVQTAPDTYYDWFRFYKPNSTVQTPVVFYKLGETTPACEHEWDEGTVVPATCTEDGYTLYTCSKCGATKKDNAVPATGHSYVDGICENCDAAEPIPGEAFTLTDSLNDGDELLIYYVAGKTVLANTLNGNKLAGVEATVTDNTIEAPEGAAVFTVTYAEGSDTNFYLITQDGKYFTSAAAGGSVSLEAAASNLGLWYLVPVTGGFHIMNLEAAYNGNKNQALEWYSGFTTYGVKDTEAYLFQLFTIPTVACEHNFVAGTPVAATCTAEGYTPYTCSLCNRTEKHDTVAALGHNWVADAANSAEPTCIAEGVNAYKCSSCDETMTESGEPATGHKDANNDDICDICDKDLAAAGYTVATTVAVGDKIIIVAQHDGKYYAPVGVLGATDSSVKNALSAREVSLDGDSIADGSVDEVAIVWEVCAGSAEGTFTLRASDGKYMNWKGSGETNIQTAEDAGTDFTITCGKGNATLMGEPDRGLVFRNNKGVSQFRMYKSSNNSGEYSWVLTIYKLG